MKIKFRLSLPEKWLCENRTNHHLTLANHSPTCQNLRFWWTHMSWKAICKSNDNTVVWTTMLVHQAEKISWKSNFDFQRNGSVKIAQTIIWRCGTYMYNMWREGLFEQPQQSPIGSNIAKTCWTASIHWCAMLETVWRQLEVVVGPHIGSNMATYSSTYMTPLYSMWREGLFGEPQRSPETIKFSETCRASS